MGTPERDENQYGQLINGLPTCVFPAKNYPRIIRNIVVVNSITGSVACYRGILGNTIPVAQDPVGSNNTMRGVIKLPAGMPFFVQWSAVGAGGARDASARISSERDDNPLGGDVSQQEWNEYLISITLPATAGPNDGAIILDPMPPGCLQPRYDATILWRPSDNAARFTYYEAVVKSAFTGVTQTEIDYGFTRVNAGNCEVYSLLSWNALTSPSNTFFLSIGPTVISGPALTTDFSVLLSGFLRVTKGVTFDSTIDWAGSTTGQSIDVTSYTNGNTTYVTSGPIAFVGVAFVAPPSGKVMVHYGGRMSNNTASQSSYLAIGLFSGGSVGSGSTIMSPSDDTAVDHAGAANNSDRQGASYLITGLTAGTTYNVTLYHRVQGGTGTFSRRFVIVTPAL